MSVEKLIEALTAEAAQRAAEVRRAAEGEADAVRKEAEATVARLRAEREAEERRRDATRRRVAEARDLLAERRRRLALEQAAVERLQKETRRLWDLFMASADYPPFVKRRWEAAARLMGSVGEVRADPVTARALAGTSAPAPKIDPAVDDGFVALSSDGEVEVHERFAVRFLRLWEREGERFVAPLAEGVGHVL